MKVLVIGADKPPSSEILEKLEKELGEKILVVTSEEGFLKNLLQLLQNQTSLHE